MVTTFAISSLATFVAIGILLSILAIRRIEERALEQAEQHAKFVTRSLMQPRLEDANLAQPFSGDAFTRLQRFTTSRVLQFPIVRVKIWSNEGLVIYSDERRLIGDHYARDRGLEVALGGEAVSHVSDLNAPENPFERLMADKLLETYVPLYARGDQPGAPSGVVELYQDYAGVQSQIDQLLRTLIPILVVGLGGLYVLQLPLARRIDRVLSKRNARLEDLAEELSHQTEQLQEHLEEERATVSELAQLNRLKGEFVDVAAHELRKPLTAIAAAIKTLGRLDAEDSRTRDEVLHIAEQQADRLIDLTRRLLLRERLENGRFPITPSWFAVGELLEGVIDGLGSGADRTEVEFTEDLPTLYSDRHAIAQILTNLIENALKYSPDDSICTVRAWLDDGSVSFSIRDQGPGIPEDEIGRIFERFYRDGSPATRAEPGVGLGLHLVKELVEQLGGTIDVSSRLGEGTEFIITLPLQWSQAPDEVAAEPA